MGALVVHLPSGKKSTIPQARAIIHAIKNSMILRQENKIPSIPSIICGDINVNYSNKVQLNKFAKTISQSWKENIKGDLPDYEFVGQGEPTHYKNLTRRKENIGANLDWALAQTGKATVHKLKLMTKAPTQASKAAYNLKHGDDDYSPDTEFVEQNYNLKQSDHDPIVVVWD